MNLILSLFVIALIKLNDAYIITVDSHAEECFFDSAPAGSKLGKYLVSWKVKTIIIKYNFSLPAMTTGLMFETIEGGFLDIDVRIVGPDGKVIYQVN